MLIAIIVIVVVLALAGFVVTGFNKLRTSDVSAQEALGGIDVQLTRRADLIPNLVETVKGYAAHERGGFEEVTRARAGVAAAAKGDDVPAKAAADQALAVATLNKLVVTIPWMFFSGIANVKQRDFYEAPAGQDVPPTVDFGTNAPAAPPAPPAAPPAPEAPAPGTPPTA
jgi:LemA protein